MGTNTSLIPYTVTYGNPPPSGGGIVTGTGADWFGPLNPMSPIAPPAVKGRVLDYTSGYNLNSRPRANETITFQTLRNFADSYDLLRLLIETRKDQMSRLQWNIVPRAPSMQNKSVIATPEMKERITEIEKFFLRPDKENFWGDWLRQILEDLFVLDAPAIYRRRTVGGSIYAYQAIDGGTIKRVIDDWGHTPMAPTPAYQQILKGYPAVDYTVDELVYKPRNKRTHKVYGYGPVEQVVMTINIALRRQTWQLQSFTEGNIPEALIGTPATWTPDQVRQFQDWFDGMFEGNTAARSRARFVPGDVAKGYVPTKPKELFGEAEEWLARVLCYAFSISPQAFVSMMNRATADSAQETATADGLAPTQMWVKTLMDQLLIEDFDSPDLEFRWLQVDEIDPDKKSQIVDREHAAGRLTYNQARDEMGLDPVDHPNADRPMVRTNDGTWIPLFLTPEEQAAKDEAAEAAKEALGIRGRAGGSTPPSGGEASASDRSGGRGGQGGSGGDTPPAKAGEGASKADVPFPLAKAGGPTSSYPDPLRPFAAVHEEALKTSLADMLKRLGARVAEQVAMKLRGLGKADVPETIGGGDAIDVDALLDDIDLRILAMEQEMLAETLAAVAQDAASVTIGRMNVASPQITNVVNDRAVNWATERAAELVSFDGEDPMLARSTRNMIRNTIVKGLEDNIGTDAIAEQLADNYAFSEKRAATIAATEITAANSQGSLESFLEAEEQGVNVKKSWLNLETSCSVCAANAEEGPIPLKQAFKSGDMAPGAHPECRCVLVPEVMDDVEKVDLLKLDNRDDMENNFPVNCALRGPIWAMGGNSEEAVAEREASLLMFVPFDQCVATQNFCDHDKVAIYIADPTAKGFAPMAYFDGVTYAIQDGHHRAVASKKSGNSGMSMNVKNVDSFSPN